MPAAPSTDGLFSQAFCTDGRGEKMNALDERWGTLQGKISNLQRDRLSADGVSGHTGSNLGSGLSTPVGSRPNFLTAAHTVFEERGPTQRELEDRPVDALSAVDSLALLRRKQESAELSVPCSSEQAVLAAPQFDAWREAVAEAIADSAFWSRGRIPDGDLNVVGPQVITGLLGEVRALRRQNQDLLDREASGRADMEAVRRADVDQIAAAARRNGPPPSMSHSEEKLTREANDDLRPSFCFAGRGPTMESVVTDIKCGGREATFNGLISRVGGDGCSTVPSANLLASFGGVSRTPSPAPLTPTARDHRLGRRLDALIGKDARGATSNRPLSCEVNRMQIQSLLATNSGGSSPGTFIERARRDATPPRALPSSPLDGLRVRSPSPTKSASWAPGLSSSRSARELTLPNQSRDELFSRLTTASIKKTATTNGRDDFRSSGPAAKKPLDRAGASLRETMERTTNQQGGLITRVGARRCSQLTELQGLRSHLFTG